MSGTQSHSPICVCGACRARRCAGHIPWDSRIGARVVPGVSTQAAIAANHAIWLMAVNNWRGGYGDGR